MTYWVVCVTKYRMKLKEHENVRWCEILRIVRTQLVGTIKVESVDGQVSSIRHSKEAESKFSVIFDWICSAYFPKSLGKRKTRYIQIRLQKAKLWRSRTYITYGCNKGKNAAISW